jgi:hypothetical protein
MGGLDRTWQFVRGKSNEGRLRVSGGNMEGALLGWKGKQELQTYNGKTVLPRKYRQHAFCNSIPRT